MSRFLPSLQGVAQYAARLAARGAVSGAARARQRIRVRRFAGPSVYAQQLEHLRVVHLTDQHFGRVTPEAVQEAAVVLVNAAAPDLVVITGDFVCHSQLYLDQLTAMLARIEAPTIGVLGNHDHWAGAAEVSRAVRRAGVELLRNESTVIELGHHERLQVIGLDDAYTGHADRHQAMRGIRRDLPTLALSHIAEEADALWEQGVPLVLAGHTHGGQVTVARLHEVAMGLLGHHRYVHGLYGDRRGAAPAGTVYVSAGIGAAVVPLRLGERGKREIAVFELGFEPGDFDEHHAEQSPLPARPIGPALLDRRAAKVVRKRARRVQRERRRQPGGNGGTP